MAFWSDINRLQKKHEKRKNKDKDCIKINKNGRQITLKEYERLSKSIADNPCVEVEYLDTKCDSKFVVLFSDEDLFVTITKENGNKILTSYHFHKKCLSVTCEETEELTKEEAKIKINEWVSKKANAERFFNVDWHKGKR